MKTEELHVSSLIVYLSPSNISVSKQLIQGITGAELVTVTEQGKAIVIVEASHQKGIMKCIDQINEIDGVLSSNLVYHEFEQATQNNSEEIR